LTKVVLGTGIKGFGLYPFYSGTEIYYLGTAEEWATITNISYVSKVYFYSEGEPSLNEEGTAYDDAYWHYVDGVETPWVYVTE
jgi:hypothetical protein